MTKSAVSCGFFVTFTEEILNGKHHFLCSVFDNSIKTAPTNFFSSGDFSPISNQANYDLIGSIAFVISRKEPYNKIIHVIREIFMKKSFLYFRELI